MTVTAEDVVVKIRADVADLETKMNRAAVVTTNTTRTIERSSAAAANAGRNMGRQFADVGASLASGASPFMVIAQQAPQMADALADGTGKLAGFARFLAGPWGAAMLAAASVLGVLIEKMIAAGSTAEKTKPSIDRLANAYANLAANLGKTDAAGVQARATAELKLRTDRVALTDATNDLTAAQARLAASQQVDPKGRGSAPAQRDVAEAKARVEALKLDVARGDAFVKLAEQRFDRAKRLEAESNKKSGGLGTSRLDAEARLGAADTGLERARAQLALTKAQAAEDLKAGRISREGYRARVQAAEEAVQQQQRLSASAKKGASDEKKAQRELETALDRVLGKYDPVSAAAKEVGETLKDIDKLQMEGIISAADALGLKLKVAAEQASKIANAMWKEQEQRWLSVGLTPGDFDGSNVRKTIDGDLNRRQEEKDAAAAKALAKQEAEIRTLATIYEDAFRGGTKAVWQDFRQLGFRVLAEMLARWTMMRIGGGGGAGGGSSDIGSLFSTAVSSVLGFASGGYTGSGPRNQVAGVVHRGEFVMPANAVDRIGVAPLAAMAAGGVQPARMAMPALGALPRSSVMQPQQVVINVQANDYFDARVEKVSTGVTARMAPPIADAYATARSTQMGQQVSRAIPARMAQFQRDGT